MTELSKNEEWGLISLAFEEPDFISSIIDKLDVSYFELDECQFVFTIIKLHFDRNGTIPTRELTRDTATKHLTVDNPGYRDVLDLCGYEINPRDYSHIKENIIGWLRRRAYGAIYGEDAIEAYENEDYERIRDLVEEASKIQDLGQGGMWFFDDIDEIFNEEAEEKLTTSFPMLDTYLNEGGPTRSDTIVWMAPTGVGKSLVIVNNAAACIKRGLNVLHVTLELSEWKTAERYCGVLSQYPIKTRFEAQNREKIKKRLGAIRKAHGGDLAIFEFPADDISIDTIMALIDQLKKTRGWVPDVIAIDYLELMLSKNQHYNKEDYSKQKKVSTEIRQLAKKTNCFVITATQTNRGDPKMKGSGTAIDLDRVAESYGKMMPCDYVISINQSRDEYLDQTPTLRLYIAKNRNGPKFKTVTSRVDYSTMLVKETQDE